MTLSIAGCSAGCVKAAPTAYPAWNKSYLKRLVVWIWSSKMLAQLSGSMSQSLPQLHPISDLCGQGLAVMELPLALRRPLRDPGTTPEPLPSCLRLMAAQAPLHRHLSDGIRRLPVKVIARRLPTLGHAYQVCCRAGMLTLSCKPGAQEPLVAVGFLTGYREVHESAPSCL